METVCGFYGEDGIERIKSEFSEYVAAFEMKDYTLFFICRTRERVARLQPCNTKRIIYQLEQKDKLNKR